MPKKTEPQPTQEDINFINEQLRQIVEVDIPSLSDRIDQLTAIFGNIEDILGKILEDKSKGLKW